jgi:hypothetical protein
MKKLGKLEINSEKIMTIEELLRLRGGYSSWCCDVNCIDYHEYGFHMSSGCPQFQDYCAEDQCEYFFNQQFSGCDCECVYCGIM